MGGKSDKRPRCKFPAAELAEKLSIKGYKRLNKQDLIYKILDQQAISGDQVAESKSKEKAVEQDKPKKKKERKKIS